MGDFDGCRRVIFGFVLDSGFVTPGRWAIGGETREGSRRDVVQGRCLRSIYGARFGLGSLV